VDLKAMTVLLFIDWFDPAYKAGGPITSAVNFVNNYNQFADIKVLTTAHDIDGSSAVETDRISKWTTYSNGVDIYYAGHGEITFKFIREIYREIKPDVVYCNSMFSYRFTILPLAANRISVNKIKTVLAPRGMLKDTALAFKPFKKKLFLFFSKFLGLYNGVRFQATDQQEANDISQTFPGAELMIVGNYPSKLVAEINCIEKHPGRLHLFFLGRIHEIKQLHYLLECLPRVKGHVELSIVGPIESEDYWNRCAKMIQQLPDNIKVYYLGEQSPAALEEIYQGIHVMILPTKGENFGHAIFEAMAHAKPVIISNKTPWLNLSDSNSGFSLDLLRPSEFIDAIQYFIDIDHNSYEKWCSGAYNKAKEYLTQSGLSVKYQQLLYSC
jgi:glycosyltransferase involved in cell wall biosynthesis